jgi:hypothetical protein
MRDDLKKIRETVRAEGVMVDGQCVVPDDFFDRLNASLNPPRQGEGLIDRIIRMCDEPRTPRTYLCTCCGANPVDAEGGFDTCDACLNVR